MKKLLSLQLVLCASICYAQPAEDYYGPVSITFHGFICNRPTNDDPLGGDGVGDEVSVHFWDWTTVTNNKAHYNGVTKIYGEDFLLPFRIKAGTSTINGGLKAGDSYYREGVYGDNNPEMLTSYSIVNTFCSQNTLIVILPTIWENDQGPLHIKPLQDFGVEANKAFNDIAIKQKLWEFRDNYVYNDNNPYGYFLAGRYFGLDAKFAGLFTSQKNKLATRPIGLFPNWDFSSQVLVLTPKTIKIIAEKDYGYGKGIIPVSFNEETLGNTFGHGNYILLLRVVADIKDRNAPSSAIYSVGVKVNNAAAGEEYKFLLNAAGKFDSISIKSPNTTANFRVKMAAGQQYILSQTSGTRICLSTNKIGFISRDTIITVNCTAPSSVYKLNVFNSSSLMPVNDRYELELDGSERIILDTGHRLATFSKRFNTGDSFKVRIVSAPRPSNIMAAASKDSIAQGVFNDKDIDIYFYCTPPPLTILKMNVTGIESGETFKFADNYGRQLYVSFNMTVHLGGFPVGDPLIIRQTSGPRPCVITPTSAVVPANALTLQCKCGKPFTPPPAPANKYDLVSRSSDDKVLSTYYESWSPVISGENEDEGRFVAFVMYGKGIDGSSGNYRQIFWRDRKQGITKLVSKNAAGEEGKGNSAAPTISADGRYVVFETAATNLTSGDVNTYLRDVFLWDQQTGKLELISKSAGGQTGNGESYEPVISGDGNTIAYTSNASDIVKLEPVFNTPNIYIYDVRSGTTSFITKDYETGKAASGYAPTISDDGTKIAFCAYSNRLVKDDNNNLWDIFLWEKGSTTLKRISKTAAGGERNQGTESSSRVVWPAISGDGSSVVFATTSSNIVGDDKNEAQDIFLYNTNSGSIKRVSTLNNTEGDGDSPVGQGERIGISYDGNWITYNTNATNLSVPKGNILLQNTTTGKIIPITTLTIGSTARPMLSRHGYYVVAGCSEPYDKRFSSSGLFTIYTNLGNMQ